MKKVGYTIYVHKSAKEDLPEKHRAILRVAESYLPDDFGDYAVIKINEKDRSVSFIKSPNWDDVPEPDVGKSLKMGSDGRIKITPPRGQIYHHKHLFVREDYTGFDVEASKERSREINKKVPNTREIKTRMGYKKFWDRVIKDYDLEADV